MHWETAGPATHRLKIPGGYLYLYSGQAMVFVPTSEKDEKLYSLIEALGYAAKAGGAHLKKAVADLEEWAQQ